LYSLENEAVITSNRTRVEILASILNVAERATLKTHIMYKANLSHRQLEKYLTFLQDNDMLSQFTDEETGSRMYKVTVKGTGFLKDYSRLSSMYGENILRK